MAGPENRFHVGHEYAGFPPDPDPACFRAWQRAAYYLKFLMRDYAEEDDDAAFDAAHPDLTGYTSFEDWLASDDAPSMRATVDAILRDDGPLAGGLLCLRRGQRGPCRRLLAAARAVRRRAAFIHSR